MLTRADAQPCRAVGEGRPVVLLAGGASTSHGYFPDMEQELSRSSTLITADPPGVGRQRTREDLRLADQAAGLADFLSRANARDAVVVGHSLGGLLALRLAVDYPRLVASLILLDPTPCAPETSVKAVGRALTGMRLGGSLADRLWRRSVGRSLADHRLSEEGRRALEVYTDKRFCREAARWRHFQSDARTLSSDIDLRWPVHTRVLVVTSAHHKPTAPIRVAHQELAGRLPLASLETWPGTTHELHLQVPHMVVAAVERELRALDGAEQ